MGNVITDAFHSNQSVLIFIKLAIPVGHTNPGLFQVLFLGISLERTFFYYLDLREITGFKKISDVIIANRISNELYDVLEKVFTRDIFNDD